MLSLTNISKSFGTRRLFSEVNFNIGARDRIALLGPNGSGKSTLLEIIAGELSSDGGTITRRRDLTVGYLPQEIPAASSRPLLDDVLSAASRINSLAHRMSVIQEELSAGAGEEEPRLLKEMGELQHHFESLGGYDNEHEAKAILCGLGFKEIDFRRPLSTFSGGWLMRAALAKLLLINPDLLLLDEPTNHLDLETQIWFESYIRGYAGAVLLTSHDRAFLNRVVTRVLALENGRLDSYKGTYDDYVAAKEEAGEILAATARRQAEKIEKQERFIERFRAKNTKASQVQSRIKALARVERVEVPRQVKKIHFNFPDPPHSGQEIISLSHVRKSYDGNVVYRDLSLALYRGDKVALVGPNGAGKTTLLKILAGVLPFDSGERRLGHGVITAYYAQYQLELLEPHNTLLGEMRRAAPAETDQRLRTILGGFLFSGDDAEKRVEVLSGGEKARLALAKMLIQPANFLLMDEPTNHLDIASREVLSDALEAYQGSICFITHDRTLIREIAGKIIEIRAGEAAVFPGDYDSFLYHQETESTARVESCAMARVPLSASSTREKRSAEGALRNEYYRKSTPLKTRVEKIESELGRLEAEQQDLELKFTRPEEYKDSEKVVASLARHREVKTTIASLTVEWENLLLEIDRLKAELEAELGRL